MTASPALCGSVPGGQNVFLAKAGLDGTYYEITTSGAATSTVTGRNAEVRSAVLAIRRTKSMVLDDATDENRRSCGSFFVNPVVSAAD